MTQDVWTGGSGSWSNTGDWSNGAPQVTDDVVIDVAGITVSIGTGVAADAETIELTGSTLDIDGGTLFTAQQGTFEGIVDQSAGTYTMSGYGAYFHDALNFSGGTMDDLSGAVTLLDGGVLGGAGALDISGGVAYITTGFSATIDSIVVGANNGRLGFETNFTYGGNFTVLGTGVLDLFGHTLKLTGASQLDGVIGNGALIVSSTTTLGAPLFSTILDNGLSLRDSGTIVQAGTVALDANDSGAKIVVSRPGKYEINGNWSLTANPVTVASIDNAGLFEKTSGARTSFVDASFTSSGTVTVDIGTLLLNGLVNSLAGTVNGGGTLAVSGGQTTLGNKISLDVSAFDQQAGLLVLDHALTYAGAWNLSGGVLDLNDPSAKLTLTGLANLDGGTLTSFGGAVTIDGTANFANVVIGGPTTLDINGTVDQTASITFGSSSNPSATIAAGATWNIEGDSSIVGSFGLITNDGSFTDPNGSGDAIVQAELVNAGTITADNSTLTLAGSNLLGGTLTGTGLLDLQGYSILQSGLKIGVASLAVDNATTSLDASLSYAGILLESGGAAALQLNGNVFSDSGRTSLDGGQLTGGGTLALSGPAVIGNLAIGYTIDDNSVLAISGTAEQSSSINLDSIGEGTISIAGAGLYSIDDDFNILGPGVIDNAGTFTVAGTGTSQIGATFNNTGKLQLNDQLLQLGDGGAFAGSVSGGGTLQFGGFVGLNPYTLESGFAITSDGWQISTNVTTALATNVGYAGDFDAGGASIELNGETLTLSGSATLLGTSLTGTGTMLVSGSGTIIGANVLKGAVLDITKGAEQVGTLTVGDAQGGTKPPSTATLDIGAGATYTLDANQDILGNGTLSVAGTLLASADGAETITTTVVDGGVIAANLGTLDLISAVGGNGIFTIGTNALLEFGTLSTLTASATVSFTTGTGALVLDTPDNFGAIVADFGIGDEIALGGFSVSGSLTAVFANKSDTAVTFSETNGPTVTLSISTAQTLSNYSYGAGPLGLETITFKG
jgi:hypothetical protein